MGIIWNHKYIFFHKCVATCFTLKLKRRALCGTEHKSMLSGAPKGTHSRKQRPWRRKSRSRATMYPSLETQTQCELKKENPKNNNGIYKISVVSQNGFPARNARSSVNGVISINLLEKTNVGKAIKHAAIRHLYLCMLVCIWQHPLSDSQPSTALPQPPFSMRFSRLSLRARASIASLIPMQLIFLWLIQTFSHFDFNKRF